MTRFGQRRFSTGLLRYPLRLASSAGVVVVAVALMAQYRGETVWWDTGTGEALPMSVKYGNANGELMVYNTEGPIQTRDHAFFDGLGTNGRACVTCHQPSNAMSLATDRLEQRWKDTRGADPVFAAIDGSNCPNLPQGEKSSHSLLLNRGVFRVYLPWPAVSAAGAPVKPEFTLEVVRDPTGCNLDAEYGLKSAHPTVSVFRRPRMVGNLKFVLGNEAVFAPGLGRTGSLAADGRDESLEAQAIAAAHVHEQTRKPLTKDQLQQILDFESQVFVAQTTDILGGDLAEVDGPAALGAWNLSRGQVSSNMQQRPVFLTAKDYRNSARHTDQSDFRVSVARGNDLFATRLFLISETANLTATPASAPVMGTCSTCHTSPFSGSNARPMDVGTMVAPHALKANDLPLFKVTCNNAATPHPYLGRIIYTTDPGRALITGKCSDVGSIVMQQFRGLSARAPYFANGSAANLKQVIEFYDRRFNMHLNPQESQDLVNFLSVL